MTACLLGTSEIRRTKLLQNFWPLEQCQRLPLQVLSRAGRLREHGRRAAHGAGRHRLQVQLRHPRCSATCWCQLQSLLTYVGCAAASCLSLDQVLGKCWCRLSAHPAVRLTACLIDQMQQPHLMGIRIELRTVSDMFARCCMQTQPAAL